MVNRGRHSGLFGGAESYLGPLSEAARSRIVRYLGDPSAENWDDVYSIVLNPRGGPRSGAPGTVWQAVVAVDPSYRDIARTVRTGAPGWTKWAKCPDALLLARAIKHALELKRGMSPRHRL